MQVIAMAQKPAIVVFEEYAKEMIKCLPMNDPIFIADLFVNNLLSGDTKDELDDIPGRANEAQYLLYDVIKPSLDIDDTSSFNRLLSVMEHCDYQNVHTLSREIKSYLDKRSGIKPGTVYSKINVITSSVS